MVYDTVEIGSLGHFSKDTILTIKTVLSSILTDLSLAISQSHKILLTACKIAISCSRSIFLARNCPSWFKDKLLL